MKRIQPKASTQGSPAKQLSGFIDRFDPAIGRLVRTARTALRRQFPTAIELVYDNYNALAVGWSPNERASVVIVSLGIYARGVSLYSIQGAKLPDPSRLLQGGGKQGRFIRLADVALLDQPAVKALMHAAIQQGRTPLPATGRGYLVIKSVSAKQRPRRSVPK